MTTPVSTPLIVSLQAIEGRGAVCEPVTVGLPLPAGLARDAGEIALEDDRGQPVPLQVRPTEYWSDGSIRWALLDFQATGPAAIERRYLLHVARPEVPDLGTPLTIDAQPRQVTIATGAAVFVMKTGCAFPFASVQVRGRPVIDAAAGGLAVTTPGGRSFEFRVTEVTVEDHGRLRATVRLEGTIGPPRRPPLLVTARVQLFAGSSAARLSVTLRNPKRALHRGGHWELGDNGSVYLRDVSLHLAWHGDIDGVECAPDRDGPLETFQVPFEVYQDSSGGENWRHVSHVDRHGDIPCTFRGYRCESGAGRTDGLRATPVLVARHAGGVTGLAIEHFWQNWPKAAAVEPRRLTWRILPGHTANEHELQGGEQKTHRATLLFGDDASASDARFWGRAPAVARATPQWYCSCQAMPSLTQAEAGRYQQLVDSAIEGPDSFDQKREHADEYGWRHFGDLPADHENAFSGRSEPVVSHYNNQYDAIAGFACQFMRSGNEAWHRMMCELAAHVADIDIYHTDRDKSAYNHGLFWHTAHYVTAGRSSHRSFPRDPRVHGGGPANEHNYTSGLRLHWLLTGDPQSRAAAIELATWVITMDDGRRTVLRWLSSGATGLASQTYSPLFHGPGRGAGHSILALLDGHRLTNDAAYLEKAEELVRRCIHPADDIASLTLLDAERRWSYTVFLQVLGRYLDYRAELGRIDEHYAYARAALLHYARWMADHEYPYLDKPEILEYPTETWAAQDMRKCDVFLYAAGHCSADERRRFLDKADFFFDYSLTTLLESPTRTLTRPLVLMLSNGYLHHSPDAAAARPAPAPVADFGQPTVFVPQKVLAKRRLAMSAGIFVMFVVVTLISLV